MIVNGKRALAYTARCGKIEKIDAEKNKLTVVVQIFGRDTPVEVDVMQVEKVI